MAMNMDDVYYNHPELQSEMELRARSKSFNRSACIPSFVRETMEDEPTPDAFDKDEFDEREPAFGWTKHQIGELEERAAMDEMHEFVLFNRLKRMMLKRLISTSGAATVHDLCIILKQELESNTPAPVPAWYKFSDARFGHDFDGANGRRFGYAKCESRECAATETLEQNFQQCSKCKMACYCSRACQVADYKERHKIVCKEAATSGDKTAKVASLLDMFARRNP